MGRDGALFEVVLSECECLICGNVGSLDPAANHWRDEAPD